MRPLTHDLDRNQEGTGGEVSANGSKDELEPQEGEECVERDADEEDEGDEDGGDDSEDGDEEDGSEDSEGEAGSTARVSTVIGGTFFLKRRPLEYLLACPSDEEFAQNRPRALWKLALNYTLRVVRSRTLSWSGLLERRRQRRRYIELIEFRHRFRMDAATAREWGELVKSIHPDDLHLWHCIAMFQDRRDPIHM